MIDPQEAGQNPLSHMLGEAFNGLLRQLMVGMPGRVVAFDADRQRAQVQCGIRRVVEGQPVTLPVISDVPVQFTGNDQWYAWHEITPGTEGYIHFSQRAVDTWLSQGGPATPADFRMFAAEDAFFAPGYRSNPGVIPGFVNEGCGLSDYGGGTRIHLTDGQIVISAGGSTITVDGSGVAINGTNLTHNATNVGSTHTHPQGNDSAGDSQQNTGDPQ